MNVGADAHIGPLGSCEFAADYRKNGAICRADVGIGPYNQIGNYNMNSPEDFHFLCLPAATSQALRASSP